MLPVNPPKPKAADIPVGFVSDRFILTFEATNNLEPASIFKRRFPNVPPNVVAA